MKKNNKAFTLVEMIAVIVILALIMTIAMPAISRYLGRFRKDYYEKLEDTIASSAATYLAENRSLRPRRGEKSYICLKDLEDEKVIEPVESYNHKKCDDYHVDSDKKSFVIVERKEKDTKGEEFKYTVCLFCDRDNYSSSKKAVGDCALIDVERTTFDPQEECK